MSSPANQVKGQNLLAALDFAQAETKHLLTLLELKTMEAEAWKTMVYLTPEKALAQLLQERDEARRELAELRARCNEREPQLLEAERCLAVAEGELKVLRAGAAGK